MPTSSTSDLLGLEVKFQSAVNLIRSLPKEGQFQPSYNDASKVYGYYKQAQLGPCKDPKPGFWDVVGRAKWNAWSQLGDMSKDTAMESYVKEIKMLFEKLSTSEEFLEQQKQLSDTIIPFCEATGLALPITIKEDIKMQNIVVKKDRIKDKSELNGFLRNGHHNSSEINGTSSETPNHTSSEKLKNDTLDVIIDGKDIRVMQNGQGNESHNATENGFYLNGSSNLSENRTTDNEVDQQEENEPDKTTDAAKWEESSSQKNETSSLVAKLDSDSSDDDDVYCDSINPDNISDFITFNASSNGLMEKTTDITYNELTRVTDDSSLLEAESPPLRNLNPNSVQVHSTPAFHIVPLHNKQNNGGKPDNGTDTHHITNVPVNLFKDSKNNEGNATNGEYSTEYSSLSSHSAGDTAHQSIQTFAINESTEIEDELVREFSKPMSHHNHQGTAVRKHHSSSQKVSKEVTKNRYDVDKERQLVISARGGSSQSDLVGSGVNTGSRSRLQAEGNAERPEGARSSDQGTQHRSKRPRRRHNDSTSDSNVSSSGSEVRGETIGEQIVRALQRLEQDMQMVLLRLNSIEDRIKTANEVNRENSWAAYLPSRRMMMLLLWPVLINIIFAYWRRRFRK